MGTYKLYSSDGRLIASISPTSPFGAEMRSFDDIPDYLREGLDPQYSLPVVQRIPQKYWAGLMEQGYDLTAPRLQYGVDWTVHLTADQDGNLSFLPMPDSVLLPLTDMLGYSPNPMMWLTPGGADALDVWAESRSAALDAATELADADEKNDLAAAIQEQERSLATFQDALADANTLQAQQFQTDLLAKQQAQENRLSMFNFLATLITNPMAFASFTASGNLLSEVGNLLGIDVSAVGDVLSRFAGIENLPEALQANIQAATTSETFPIISFQEFSRMTSIQQQAYIAAAARLGLDVDVLRQRMEQAAPGSGGSSATVYAPPDVRR